MVDFIKGIIIGICTILPGISGSVIAISLGVYENFIDSISSLKNVKYLIKICSGIIIGVYTTSFLLINILKNNNLIYYFLIGIIISEIPLLIKKIKIKTNKGIDIIPFCIAFIISTIINSLNNSINNHASPLNYFIGGILFSFGKIFPGVSSSFFLLSLGIYEDIILIILNPLILIKNIGLYLPFMIGAIIGIIIFIKLLKLLLVKKYRLIYSIISGLILSSVSLLIPRIDFIGCLFTSFIIISSLLYKTKKDFN